MHEYEIYAPLHYNDGRPIAPESLRRLKSRLTEEFGGLTHFLQANEGLWKVGAFTYRDRVIILRVLSERREQARAFLGNLKATLALEWDQEDVLIVERAVETV